MSVPDRRARLDRVHRVNEELLGCALKGRHQQVTRAG